MLKIIRVVIRSLLMRRYGPMSFERLNINGGHNGGRTIRLKTTIRQ